MDKRTKELVKLIRSGVRLDTKAPRVEKPKSVYCRKAKHKRRISDESSSFLSVLSHPFILMEASFPAILYT